jgi:hypothetical protein
VLQPISAQSEPVQQVNGSQLPKVKAIAPVTSDSQVPPRAAPPVSGSSSTQSTDSLPFSKRSNDTPLS